MRPSVLKTITIPASGTENPAVLAIAAGLPMRLAIRNVGPALVFLAHQGSSIQSATGFAASEVYQIGPGEAEVFVLAPKQGMYAVAQGAGGALSFALSEAVPGLKWES